MMLRDYQKDAVNHFRGSDKNTCYVFPTGTGKTTIIAAIVDEYQKGDILIVAPTHFIKAQIIERLQLYGIRHKAEVVVFRTAAIRSMSASLVIFDECHRIACQSNQQVAGRAQRVIGFTATPVRLDEEPLNPLNDLYEPHNLKWFMDRGYLCSDIRYMSLPISVDFTKIGSDYHAQYQIMNKKYLYDSMTRVASTEKVGQRKSIVFGTTVEHCQELLLIYSQVADVKPAIVSYNQSLTERDAIIERFKSGDVNMLINCFLLTEGVDLPECDCVIFAAYTSSLTRYYQAIGRGLRPGSNKQLLVIDHTGVVRTHHSILSRFSWASEFWGAFEKRQNQIDRKSWVLVCPFCQSLLSSTLVSTCPDCGESLTPEQVEVSNKHRLGLRSKPDVKLEEYQISVVDEILAKVKKAKSLKARLKLVASIPDDVLQCMSDDHIDALIDLGVPYRYLARK